MHLLTGLSGHGYLRNVEVIELTFSLDMRPRSSIRDTYANTGSIRLCVYARSVTNHSHTLSIITKTFHPV